MQQRKYVHVEFSACLLSESCRVRRLWALQRAVAVSGEIQKFHPDFVDSYFTYNDALGSTFV
jgi:hypothetical protein